MIRKRISVGVNPLAPGQYKIRFRVLSVDGHVVEDEVRFYHPRYSASAMTGLEVAVRCVHLAVVLLLVGTFSFELLVSRPVFKTAGAQMSLHFLSLNKAQFRITLRFNIGDRHSRPRTVHQDCQRDGSIVRRIIRSWRYHKHSHGNSIRNSLACTDGALLFARHDVG